MFVDWEGGISRLLSGCFSVGQLRIPIRFGYSALVRVSVSLTEYSGLWILLKFLQNFLNSVRKSKSLMNGYTLVCMLQFLEVCLEAVTDSKEITWGGSAVNFALQIRNKQV